MSLRLALYFLIPLVFHILFCIEYIPDWNLAHLLTVAYMYGYSCYTEYKVLGEHNMFISLLLLVCSILGCYLYYIYVEYNDLICSTFITSGIVLLFIIGKFSTIALPYILIMWYKHMNIFQVTEVLITTLSDLCKRHSAPETNHSDEVAIRLNGSYINNLADSVLKQRYYQLDTIEHDWYGYFKVVFQVAGKIDSKISKLAVEIISISLFHFLLAVVIVLINYKELDHWYTVMWKLLVILSYVHHSLMYAIIDRLLGLCKFEHIVLKAIVTIIIRIIYVNHVQELTTECSHFIHLELLRSSGNLFLMPYLFSDFKNYTQNLKWLQVILVVAQILNYSFLEQYRFIDFLDLIICVYLCSILLFVVELKLFAQDNFMYRLIFLTIITVLGMIFHSQVQKQWGKCSSVSHIAVIAFFSALCMYFNHMVSSFFFRCFDEYMFTIFTFKDLYQKNWVSTASFVLMQLVHVGSYCIYFTAMFWLANDTYAAIFEKDTKEINWNIKIGLIHLGIPVTDKIIILTLFLSLLILVLISIYILVRFHFYYRSMLIYFVWGHTDRYLSKAHRFGLNKIHDVFLSYSEECDIARPFVLNKLCPQLKNETGLSVISSEDISPGQMFYTKLSEKMASCRKVVIVWTKAYEMDGSAYRIQFEMLLAPLMKERVFQERDLYIIRLENTPISLQASLLGEIVEWNFDINSEETKLRKFGKRILQSISEDNCLVNRIKRWFCNMLGRIGR